MLLYCVSGLYRLVMMSSFLDNDATRKAFYFVGYSDYV
jgi:hypothetical protein